MRELEMRAEACLSIAEEALCRPDYVQVHRQKLVPLEDGYDLRLNSHARYVRPNAPHTFYGSSEVSNYLYITGGNTPKFSLDISSLDNGEVNGLTDDTGLLNNAYRITNGETQAQLGFVRRLIAGVFDEASLKRMHIWFTTMLESGITQTYSFRSAESETLEVYATQYEDSEKRWDVSPYGAPTSISVRLKNEERATILDRTPNSTTESYEKYKDDRELIEAASETDLLRSDEGRVIGMKNAHHLEAVIGEVDRVLGRRALTHAKLERIEQGTAVLSEAMVSDTFYTR